MRTIPVKPLILSTAVAILLFFAASAEAALEMSSKRECAVCHVMWMDDFKSGEETLVPFVGTNVLMKNTFGVVSSEEMCYSCHDGFVKDSRRVWTGKRHTVFKKPTGKVHIDEKKFPLSVKDEVYCGTCHSIHASASEQITSYKVFLRMDNRNSGMCLACHSGYDAGPEKGSHSVMKEMKKGFPESLSHVGLRPDTTQKRIICNSCHKVHGTEREDLIPASAALSDFCGECHKDANVKKAGEGTPMAHKMGTDLVEIKPSEALKKGGAKFENNRLGCLSCHKVHKGKSQSILVMDNADSDLCLQCHKDMKGISETPHDLKITGKDLRTVKDKTAAEVGTCGICHGSHGWAQKLAPGKPLATEVCEGCHGQGRKVTKIDNKGPYSHTVGKNLGSLAKDLKTGLPLFAEDLSKGDKVYCATCHNPHRAAEKVKDERGLIRTKFLRAESKTDLCTTCHINQKYVKGTGHDAALFEKKYENIKGQKTADAGLCGTCHLVHEGPKPIGFAVPALVKSYPAEIGRNPENLYCLSCHEEGRVGGKKLTGLISHPLGGKPGEAEGKKKEAEVTCISCHNAHRWSPSRAEAGPGKNVDGDLTNSFLRVDNSKGDLCKECHKTAYKVFGTRHDVSEKEKKGVCEYCHVAHNGKERPMWARDISKTAVGEKLKSRLCLECHRSGAPGEKALVKFYRHPEKLLFADPSLLAKADPKKENKIVETEVICVTCHNPHVWSKDKVEGAAGKEISSRTAFLKMGDPARTLCANCHRAEARYKYQFFHKEKSRIENSPYYDSTDIIDSLKKMNKKKRAE